MTPDADVIIAGAGPAGSIAAYFLAREGVSVLLLEKSAFPRYKVCGAGLTHKILAEIPYDLSPVIQTQIHSVRFTTHHGEEFTRTSESPMMYCTMRDLLDAHLAEQAVAAGAKIRFGEQVMSIAHEAGKVEIRTRNGGYRSILLIGADGASSLTARITGLRRNIELGLAWEAEIPVDPEFLESITSTVWLDWGTLPGGYAWMFPKRDHVSVGVGGPARLAGRMEAYYRGFYPTPGPSPALHHTHPQPLPTSREGRPVLRSWPIPVRLRKGDFHNGNIVVVGDAAGLTDALTGEGIYYAVKSGRLAAAACLDCLQGRSATLAAYSEAVNTEVMPELLEAVKIRNIFNTVPRTIHRLVRDHDRVWRAFGKVLRGERSYADVRTGFGKWQFLWGAATLASGMIYKVKESVWKKRS